MKSIVFLEQKGHGAGIRSKEMLQGISSLGKPVNNVLIENTLGLMKWAISNPSTSLRQSDSSALGFWPKLLVDGTVSKLVKLRGDILAVHAEDSFMGYVAYMASRILNVPYVLDLHGLWGEEYLGEHGSESSEYSSYLGELEKTTVLQANHVIAVSNPMKDHLVSVYGASPNNITVIPNGGFVSKRRAKFSSRMNLIYGGVFAYWERVEDFIGMALHPKGQQFDFLLLGSGPRKSRLLKELHKQKPSNLAYLGLKPREDALEIFSRCQIGIAPSSSDSVRQVAWPIKVMDYMSCGLPVIAPRIGEWAEMIRSSGAGIVTERSDPEEFCAAAQELSREESWMKASRSALETIESGYLWDDLMQPLDSIYSSIL